MMATLRLIDALPDFGPRTSHTVETDFSPPQRSETRAPQADVGEMIRQEVARAEQALGARLAEEHDAALVALRDRHAAELAEQASQLGEVAGRTIAARLGAVETGLVDHVTEAVARIVGGILSDDLQKRSIESLVQAIRGAIGDTEAIRMEVRGPQSLFAALVAVMPERTGSIDYVESEGFDLTVMVDGNLFETRLSEWSRAVSEILA